MLDVHHQRVAVLGHGPQGQAAARLLVRHCAHVVVFESPGASAQPPAVAECRALGVVVRTVAQPGALERFDLAVLASADPALAPIRRRLADGGVPIISELELGYQFAQCLVIGVAGLAGKRTTLRLIERILECAPRRVAVSGGERIPLSDLAEVSKDLEYVLVEMAPWELEVSREFRPTVSVLLNLPGDDRQDAAWVAALTKLWGRQEPFEWVVLQAEAHSRIRAAGFSLAAKIVTFSGTQREADLVWDRGLILSRLPDWQGPLLNLAASRFWGAHLAEDVMAAMAVGRIVRVPLERMVTAVLDCAPLPDRCESLGRVGEVQFYNDALSGALASTREAILSMPAAEPGASNVLLIAGGADSGLGYHDLGPVLARRVKHAFLFGEARESLRAAWGLFTPCTLVGTVLEAASVAAQSAVPGDIVLLSPACSNRKPSAGEKSLGEVFREAVKHMGLTMGSGASRPDPIPWVTGESLPAGPATEALGPDTLPRRFLRENAGAKPTETSDHLHS